MAKQRKSPQPLPKLLSREAAARDMAQMDAANARPIDLSLLAPEGWMHKGGQCGFKVNGFAVTRVR